MWVPSFSVLTLLTMLTLRVRGSFPSECVLKWAAPATPAPIARPVRGAKPAYVAPQTPRLAPGRPMARNTATHAKTPSRVKRGQTPEARREPPKGQRGPAKAVRRRDWKQSAEGDTTECRAAASTTKRLQPPGGLADRLSTALKGTLTFSRRSDRFRGAKVRSRRPRCIQGTRVVP